MSWIFLSFPKYWKFKPLRREIIDLVYEAIFERQLRNIGIIRHGLSHIFQTS